MEGGEPATTGDPSRPVSTRVAPADVAGNAAAAGPGGGAVHPHHGLQDQRRRSALPWEKPPVEQYGFGLNHEQIQLHCRGLRRRYAAVAGLLAAFVMDRVSTASGCCPSSTPASFLAPACAPWRPTIRCCCSAASWPGRSAASERRPPSSSSATAFADVRRGTAMGVLMSAFSVASIVGVPVGLVVADVFVYWQAPFAALAGLGVLVLVLMQVVLPSLPRPAGAAPVGFWSILARYRTVLVHPNHLIAYLFMIVLVLGSFTVGAFTPDFLMNNLNMDKWSVDSRCTCAAAGATLRTLTWFGRLSDRYGKSRLMFRVLAALTAGRWCCRRTAARGDVAAAGAGSDDVRCSSSPPAARCRRWGAHHGEPRSRIARAAS